MKAIVIFLPILAASAFPFSRSRFSSRAVLLQNNTTEFLKAEKISFAQVTSFHQHY